MPVADNQPMSGLITQVRVLINIPGDLGFNGLQKHLPGSLSQQLFEY
jgi:hypothetical protein